MTDEDPEPPKPEPQQESPATDAPIATDAPPAPSSPLYADGYTETPSEPEPPDWWDRATSWLMTRGALPALGAITLLMIIIYAGVFRGEPVGDDLTFHMAESARIADCLRAGDFDLWNPSANAGFASAYYYQVVPQLASAIPAAVFGHHLFFFQLSVVLPLVLAPLAAYRGTRLLGATPWQAVLAALAIGFVNGESRWGTGNAGTFSVGLYTQTWALAAFPMALGHAARWGSEARGLAPAVAWGAFVTLCHPFAGVSLGVALLAGWFAQYVVLVGCLGLKLISGGLPDQPSDDLIRAALYALRKRWSVVSAPPYAGLGELFRLAILAVLLAIAWLPVWLPLIIDYAGFGGFPHRVADEVGPGFGQLARWYALGGIFDYARPVVLTWLLPVVAVFARARFLRWLWAPVVVYAVWLGLGPHLGKTDDDLVPAVRFLGAMQVTASLAIGAGVLMIVGKLWQAREGSPLARGGQIATTLAVLSIGGGIGVGIWLLPDNALWPRFGDDSLVSPLAVRGVAMIVVILLAGYAALSVWRATRTQYNLRTALSVILAVFGVLLVGPGARALLERVHVLADYEASHRSELIDIAERLQHERPGRKQAGNGAENHWWNLLTYEYGRRPALLMMGGGGLQASPNYDFLWTVRDFQKLAWVYDAPVVVYEKKSAAAMPPGEDLFDTKHYQVRRLAAPGLVSPVHVTGMLPPGRKAAHAAAIDWLQTAEPLKDHVLAYDGSGPVGTLGPAVEEPAAKVTRAVRQDSPGDAPDIVAEADVTAPTTLMARESWHPRWHAFVDGKPAPVRRVTPDFPAVDVPAGHHVVGFRFERPWWAQAAWLAWPLTPLLAWLATRRRRRITTAE